MKPNKSLLKLITLHLVLIVVAANCVLFLFFQFVLPVMTHHGQFITVPNLKGNSLEEVAACLTQRNLRFEVTEDFAYLPEYPPMTVLQQYPKAGAYVKKDRKIYLTLNTNIPPEVKMPNLVDGSIRNAQVCLKSQGLLLGAIQHVPDIAQNAVLEQWYQGKQIAPGTLVKQGSRIDLVVGAGLGKQKVEIPQAAGIRLEAAQHLFLSAGLKVGNITYEPTPEQAPGTVLRQVPAAGKKVYIGESIDLWLVEQQEVVAPDVPHLPAH